MTAYEIELAYLLDVVGVMARRHERAARLQATDAASAEDVETAWLEWRRATRDLDLHRLQAPAEAP